MSVSSHAPCPAVDGEEKVEAVLVGGPLGLPTAQRYRQASRTDTKIKVVYLNGYEHFERIDDRAGAADPRPLVFEWTTRTKRAE